jgi:hypothetical protein
MNVYNAIKKDLFRIVIFVFLLILVLNFFKVGWDSTDGESRSGLGLHTDNLTGCQYLSSSRGGLIPRLDSDGTHICNRQDLLK